MSTLPLSAKSCPEQLSGKSIVPHELDFALVLVRVVRIVHVQELVLEFLKPSGRRRTLMDTLSAHACLAACAA
eukprot:6205336-Pleurochrysis_carterae.AAC.2